MALNEPYNLDPRFEWLVLLYCASKPRFWARVGASLEAASMASPEAQYVLDACKVVEREIGRGPDGTVIVVQRLRRWMDDGKVRFEDVQAVAELFDRAQDLPAPPSEDAVSDELAPIIRRRLQSQAVLAAHDEFASRGDFTRVVDLVDRARRVGKREEIGGVRLGPVALDDLERLMSMERLPTGIFELDDQMQRETLARGQLGVALGGAGDGKSMFLIQQAAEAYRRHLFVAFATLELPEPLQLVRLVANLTGTVVNDLLSDAVYRRAAADKIAEMTTYLGRCRLAEFPPHATTVMDLNAWLDRLEEEEGARVDCLVVDYADKLMAGNVNRQDMNEYLAMRYVYEGLRRDVAVARGMWVWTASQAGRASGDGRQAKKNLDLNAVADSYHKVRVADLVLTLNYRNEAGTSDMTFFVAKNRTGRSRIAVGPLPVDFEKARIVPHSSEWVAPF